MINREKTKRRCVQSLSLNQTKSKHFIWVISEVELHIHSIHLDTILQAQNKLYALRFQFAILA